MNWTRNEIIPQSPTLLPFDNVNASINWTWNGKDKSKAIPVTTMSEDSCSDWRLHIHENLPTGRVNRRWFSLRPLLIPLVYHSNRHDFIIVDLNIYRINPIHIDFLWDINLCFSIFYNSSNGIDQVAGKLGRQGHFVKPNNTYSWYPSSRNTRTCRSYVWVK